MVSSPLPVSGVYPSGSAPCAWPAFDRAFSDHLLAAYGGDVDAIYVDWIVSANLAAMGMDPTCRGPAADAFNRLGGRERAASIEALGEAGAADRGAYLEPALPPYTSVHVAAAHALLGDTVPAGASPIMINDPLGELCPWPGGSTPTFRQV